MSTRRLAILGARPRFGNPRHVGVPNIGDRAAFQRLVDGALDRRWLTNDGELAQALERRLGGVLGVDHCVLVSSGTTALSLAARAAGLTGEVIIPSFTFVGTAHALRWLGLTPVFADIHRPTHLIDPASVEALITPRTTGIVGVHLWGEPCDTESLEAIAKRHGLVLLFDAAHAFGVGHLGRRIGGFGLAEALSFHATKIFNTLEGGAVATNDEGMAARVRSMRNFGFRGLDHAEGLGINGKMNEISAGMGLANLDHIEAFVAWNRRNYDAYASGLAAVPGVRLLAHGAGSPRNHQYVVLEVNNPADGPTRDQLLDVLRAENILARRYYWPGCHRVEPYRSERRPGAGELPITDDVAARVLALPTGTAVTVADVEAICEVITIATEQADRLPPAQ